MVNPIPYSILDISPIPQGFTAADALRHSLDVAQHAEKWGYTRYWVAEHHNMTGNASSATAVLIGYLAAGTNHIRVGSGGVMLRKPCTLSHCGAIWYLRVSLSRTN
jgi:luciferase family oxidoreductase group 1